MGTANVSLIRKARVEKGLSLVYDIESQPLTIVVEKVTAEQEDKLANDLQTMLANLFGMSETNNSCQVIGEFPRKSQVISKIEEGEIRNLEIKEVRGGKYRLAMPVSVSKEKENEFPKEGMMYVKGYIESFFSLETKTTVSYLKPEVIIDLSKYGHIEFGSICDTVMFKTLTDKTELKGKVIKVREKVVNGLRVKRFLLVVKDEAFSCYHRYQDDEESIEYGETVKVVGRFSAMPDRTSLVGNEFVYQVQVLKIEK